MNYNSLDRKSLSEKIRNQVYSKNNGLCFYCGCIPKKIFADHFKPVSLGGSDKMQNLVPSCQRCNRLKSNSTIEEFRERYVRMEVLQYPKFSYEQKLWMLRRGLDVDKEIAAAVKEYEFYFEGVANGVV